jgi:hypothetical protein
MSELYPALRRVRHLLWMLLIPFIFQQCKDDDPEYKSVAVVTPLVETFSFKVADNPDLPEDITLTIHGDTITGRLPYYTDLSSLVASFTYTGTDILVGGASQQSGISANDFTRPVLYKVVNEDIAHQQWVMVDRDLSPLAEIHAFTFEAAKNPGALHEDVSLTVQGDRIIGFAPEGTDLSALVATVTTSAGATTLRSMSEPNAGDDYSRAVVYTVEAEDGTLRDYKIYLYQQTSLPQISITTDDGVGITSTDDYVNGSVKITNADMPYEGRMRIKGRGNSTWTLPKKPYRIKLDSKASWLGMPASKDWVLLANYSDKSLMRNHVSYELGRRLGMPFTLPTQFVEVTLNGEFLGNYLLTEQVEVNKDRVDIKELDEDDVDATKITGGYLLEVDKRYDETYCFTTTQGVAFCLKSDATAEQQAYITQYIQQTEDVLYGDAFADPVTGYAAYLNVDTFIDWYIVTELARNNDGVFFSSVYMYKDRGKKLNMGPLWDFDIAMGNIDYNGNENPEGWWIRDAAWINRLLQDPAFVQRLKDRWNTVRASVITPVTTTFIDETAGLLSATQQNNFLRWPILEVYVWPNAVIPGSYEGEVDYLKNWLRQRMVWMDAAINAL